MMTNSNFWANKRVLVTGHTGFKGSWMSIWLNLLGANVSGYSLEAPTNPSLFKVSKLSSIINSNIGDIRDFAKVKKVIEDVNPEIIFHMAAQPLVRESYINPLATYEVNVMGTANLLEAARQFSNVKAIVNVTTDKCYENKEWVWGYRENEPLGGHDPYSSSKACSELVTSSYRNSYFAKGSTFIASARAGNVIGGGDWAVDRLIPDCLKSLTNNETILIRNPNSIRPWQHVLEPLSGYLLLAQNLYNYGEKYAEAWNFGPEDEDAKSVKWIVEKICSMWGNEATYVIDKGYHPHEAQYLKLDCSKAKMQLEWKPRWSLEEALSKIIEWTHSYRENGSIMDICINQINSYCKVKE
ncbi:CDP-glucose 4,6-dehydratase [Paenibacillus marchantiophytorum]|uniref:CDP-glucose 4,6-dehydratase n=2 Tax=Paenibacillus marchantiophytorum TaxID=1619310 RepID=A0ABQ2BTX6_9BACL|nr:CDP-glucose 4,6-dehydratase [Paenibacillus marchantiophytorum]